MDIPEFDKLLNCIEYENKNILNAYNLKNNEDRTLLYGYTKDNEI